MIFSILAGGNRHLCESWALLPLFLSDTLFPSHAAMISTELNTWEGLSADLQFSLLSSSANTSFLDLCRVSASSFSTQVLASLCLGSPPLCHGQELSLGGQLSNLRAPLVWFSSLGNYFSLLSDISVLKIFLSCILCVFLRGIVLARRVKRLLLFYLSGKQKFYR